MGCTTAAVVVGATDNCHRRAVRKIELGMAMPAIHTSIAVAISHMGHFHRVAGTDHHIAAVSAAKHMDRMNSVAKDIASIIAAAVDIAIIIIHKHRKDLCFTAGHIHRTDCSIIVHKHRISH